MNVSDMDFPESDTMSVGFWQPVYFRPNFDSPERLVVGVLGQLDGRWHLVRASAIDRLKCLYGKESSVALEAVDVGLTYLESSIGAKGFEEGLTEVVSGLEVGGKREGQATDARQLAERWVRLISSLHDTRREVMVDMISAAAQAPGDAVEREISRDRLSVLVMTRMAEIAPQSRAMFNPHVHRLEQDQGARLLTHKAYVAFTGKNIAANFATIKPGHQRAAVNITKRLMWDLEQHRDTGASLLPKQQHEMLLYHPGKEDPTISDRQYGNVMEVVQTLQREGENREIKVLPYESVPNIADHILEVEGLRS